MAPGQMLYSMPNVSQAYRTVPLDVNTPDLDARPRLRHGVVRRSSRPWTSSPTSSASTRSSCAGATSRPRTSRTNLPFSTRRLRECYTVGAREFGWDRRNPKPRSTRDGDWLIGLGMAAGVYDPGRFPAQARARLDADGTAVVEAATSDMGPGTYTSQTQVAADALGLTMRTVTFRLGDSLYPQTAPHGGSATMASVGSAVLDACDKVRQQAIKLAVEDRESPLYGVDADDVVVRNGRLHVRGNPARGETYQQLLARNDRSHLEARGSYAGPPTPERHSYYAYSATFAEVAVDATWAWCGCGGCSACTTRAASSAPSSPTARRSAASWAASATALLEHTVTDHRDGRIVNANLADYLVPVNADVPEVRAIYLDGRGQRRQPAGRQGARRGRPGRCGGRDRQRGLQRHRPPDP